MLRTQRRRLHVRLRILIVTMLVLSLALSVAPTRADESVPFADPAFESTWAQADATVASGQTPRSWLWGPEPIGVSVDVYTESTAHGYGRLVQYFDKARMEITHPDGDTSSPWYVTNGLLVKELVSGQRQSGDNDFDGWSPAYIAVAGDLGDSRNLMFADFEPYTTLDGVSNRASDRSGQEVDSSLYPGSAPGSADGFPGATYGYYEPTLGHNIASVFWSWMNDASNGITTYGTWVYPMGLPISEPYWTRVAIGGQLQNVLVQLFERRVLTYTPSNPANWRVEMGNVGAAYMHWFDRPRITSAFYMADRSGNVLIGANQRGNMNAYAVSDEGGVPAVVANGIHDETPVQSLSTGDVLHRVDIGYVTWHFLRPVGGKSSKLEWHFPLYSPDGQRVAHMCEGGPGICIRSLASGETVALVQSSMGGATFISSWLWSPDGKYLAFLRFKDESQVAILPFLADTSTGEVRQIGPDNLFDSPDADGYPRAWAPDSKTILISAFDVVNGERSTQTLLVNAEDPQQMTLFPVDGAFDFAFSSEGVLAFAKSDANDQRGIWTSLADGSQLTQLTSGSYDRSPQWNVDGTRIVYIEEGGSPNGAVSVINADGSGYRQIFRP